MGMKIKAVAAVLILAGAFAAGWKVNGWRLGEQIATAEAKAQQAAKDQAHADARAKGAVIDAATARLEARRQKERETIREVTRYVEKKRSADNDDTCRVDGEWVRMHNKSAVPATGSTAGDHAGTGGIEAFETLPVITGNYRRCYEWRDRLITLQDWVRQTRDN